MLKREQRDAFPTEAIDCRLQASVIRKCVKAQAKVDGCEALFL